MRPDWFGGGCGRSSWTQCPFDMALLQIRHQGEGDQTQQRTDRKTERDKGSTSLRRRLS